MNYTKNRTYALFRKSIFIAALLLITMITLCSAEETDMSAPSAVEKIEVYHFHPTNGCDTCTMVGNYAEDTVKKYYAAELESGKIVFDHINFQDPENADLVEKYEVTGSSLMIGVYNATEFHKEENIRVWYKINDENEYMEYLKELLDKRLAGDFSV